MDERVRLLIRVLHINVWLRRAGKVAQNVEASFVNDEPGFVQIKTILKRYASQLLSERNDTYFVILHGALFGGLRRSDGILAAVFLYGGSSKILAAIPPKRRSR